MGMTLRVLMREEMVRRSIKSLHYLEEEYVISGKESKKTVRRQDSC